MNILNIFDNCPFCGGHINVYQNYTNCQVCTFHSFHFTENNNFISYNACTYKYKEIINNIKSTIYFDISFKDNTFEFEIYSPLKIKEFGGKLPDDFVFDIDYVKKLYYRFNKLRGIS